MLWIQDVTLFHSKWSPNLRETGHRRAAVNQPWETGGLLMEMPLSSYIKSQGPEGGVPRSGTSYVREVRLLFMNSVANTEHSSEQVWIP